MQSPWHALLYSSGTRSLNSRIMLLRSYLQHRDHQTSDHGLPNKHDHHSGGAKNPCPDHDAQHWQRTGILNLSRGIALIIRSKKIVDILANGTRVALDSCNEGIVVVGVESMEEVPDEFIFIKRLDGGGELRSKHLHLCEVLRG